MPFNDFDSDAAKKFLAEKDRKEREEREGVREKLLQKVISILKGEFADTSVEVYLIGSILSPFKFYSISDVDIVLKG